MSSHQAAPSFRAFEQTVFVCGSPAAVSTPTSSSEGPLLRKSRKRTYRARGPARINRVKRLHTSETCHKFGSCTFPAHGSHAPLTCRAISALNLNNAICLATSLALCKWCCIMKLSGDAIQPRHRLCLHQRQRLLGLSLILTRGLIPSDLSIPTRGRQSTSAGRASE